MQQILASPTEHVVGAGLILSGVKGVLYLIGGVIAAVLCAFIARSKGYSAILFAVLGFFFSIITLIVVLVIPKRR
ncbi:MAG: deoxyribodipyrimidine photolyase [Pseudonocardiales bacterium]|nr:MAG: deoxyribodipyrimidine photolyase [Pseudonocardiales bacterium]